MIPWFFPHRVFHVKNLDVDLYDYLHHICSLFDSVFTAQRGKRIRTCELIRVNWCPVVPSFPNIKLPKLKKKLTVDTLKTACHF